MGAAYSPGLLVAEHTLVRKERRLPLLGDVAVSIGDKVSSQDVVARTDLPGKVYAVNGAGQLNVLEADLPALMLKKVGDPVRKDEAIAETSGVFGYFKTRLKSPVHGTVEAISDRTGRVMIREAPTPVEVRAYVDGEVVQIHAGEGCTIETLGMMCQGIFGLGGEVEGPIHMVGAPNRPLEVADVTAEVAGRIVVGGSLLSLPVYDALREAGAAAVVTGGLHYRDIKQIVGYEIGVAITGTEPLATTILVTEGFGEIAMAKTTYDLLAKYAGCKASVNGATQIRAGVIRPEVIVSTPSSGVDHRPPPPPVLELGSPIRIIRAPHFGVLGTVAELPVGLATMPSETQVRVLVAVLDDGQRVTVPRANVEIIQGHAPTSTA